MIFFRTSADMIPEMTWVWLAKAIGAISGSAISLAYILPSSRREAALRLTSGFAIGVVFGAPVGLWMSHKLGINENLGIIETSLMGSALSSLVAWWAIGLLHRLFLRQYPIH